MDNVQRISQVYIQAPWRKQLQYVGLFLLSMVLIAMVAFFYINVTARAAAIGRSIQLMQSEIEVLRRDIVDLETEMALLTAHTMMLDRAADLGFYKVDPDEVIYLLVPGYNGRQPVSLGSSTPPPLPSASSLSPDYTQSLFEWLRERVFDPAAPLLEIEP
jgi:cell division protein FtsB